ncbi:MAG: hypothetical protein EBT33_20295, partial [Betaproteobacteria bacterium]|nr:hypothetical protein [Betaproteobacteria bacterium]
MSVGCPENASDPAVAVSVTSSAPAADATPSNTNVLTAFTNAASTSINRNAYMSFTLTPGQGKAARLDSVSLTTRQYGTNPGAASAAIATSVDGFQTLRVINLASAALDETWQFALDGLVIDQATEVRIYAWGMTGSNWEDLRSSAAGGSGLTVRGAVFTDPVRTLSLAIADAGNTLEAQAGASVGLPSQVSGSSVTLTGLTRDINTYLAAGNLKMRAAADTTLTASVGSGGITVKNSPVSVEVFESTAASRQADSTALTLPGTLVVRHGGLTFDQMPFGTGNATLQRGSAYSLRSAAGLQMEPMPLGNGASGTQVQRGWFVAPETASNYRFKVTGDDQAIFRIYTAGGDTVPTTSWPASEVTTSNGGGATESDSGTASKTYSLVAGKAYYFEFVHNETRNVTQQPNLFNLFTTLYDEIQSASVEVKFGTGTYSTYKPIDVNWVIPGSLPASVDVTLTVPAGASLAANTDTVAGVTVTQVGPAGAADRALKFSGSLLALNRYFTTAGKITTLGNPATLEVSIAGSAANSVTLAGTRTITLRSAAPAFSAALLENKAITLSGAAASATDGLAAALAAGSVVLTPAIDGGTTNDGTLTISASTRAADGPVQSATSPAIRIDSLSSATGVGATLAAPAQVVLAGNTAATLSPIVFAANAIANAGTGTLTIELALSQSGVDLATTSERLVLNRASESVTLRRWDSSSSTWVTDTSRVEALTVRATGTATALSAWLATSGKVQFKGGTAVDVRVRLFAADGTAATSPLTNLLADTRIDMLASTATAPATPAVFALNLPTTVVADASANGAVRFNTVALAGGAYVERWTGVSGAAVADMLSKLGTTPNDTFWVNRLETTDTTVGNYGLRVRGTIVAPVTGDYQFAIASDDHSSLRLSTDDTAANLREIAFLQSVSTSYTANASQTSSKIRLEAGRAYYYEALLKEASGQDFVKVRWTLPGGQIQDPIPMSALQPHVLQSPTTQYTVRISADRGVLSAASASGLTVSTANGQVTIVGTADKINAYLRSANGLSYQGSGGALDIAVTQGNSTASARVAVLAGGITEAPTIDAAALISTTQDGSSVPIDLTVSGSGVLTISLALAGPSATPLTRGESSRLAVGAGGDGVTVTLDATGSKATLVGTAAALNAYLATDSVRLIAVAGAAQS